MLCSLQSHILYLSSKLDQKRYFLVELWMVSNLDLDFASGAIHEFKINLWSCPSFLYFRSDTAQVEDMTANQHYGWLISESADLTKLAVVIIGVAFEYDSPWIGFIVLPNAFRLKTGETNSLLVKSFASMSTGMSLVTTILHVLNALRLATDILKDWVGAQ